MRIYPILSGVAMAALLLTAPIGASAESSKAANAPNGNNLVFDTTPESHARLSEIFGNEHSAQRVKHVRFSLAPGSVIPGSIHLVPLPETIVAIQPTWQGSDYFRIGRNKVVIVDPQSKKIEGVLTL
jgi:hypothetical protein